MAASTAASASSLKEYLKRYETNYEEEKKKSKKKKRKQPVVNSVCVVDEDPIWQKPVKLEENNEDSSDEEKPQVDEDIEVKRMKRLELLRSRQPYHAISEDGSGWVSVSDTSKANDLNPDMSPPRRARARYDTPSPEPELNTLKSGREDAHLSPPRQRRRHHSTSQELTPQQPLNSNRADVDLSPPRQPSRRQQMPPERGRRGSDLSPPRKQQRHQLSPSPEHGAKGSELTRGGADLSPPWQRRRSHRSSPEPEMTGLNIDSSQRSVRHSRNTDITDISPPRRGRQSSPPQDGSNLSPGTDLSPPRKSRKDKPKTGLITSQDIKEVNAKTKMEDMLRFKKMDPSIMGRDVEPVYRDKIKGERISKDDFLKQHKKEEKPKEVKLEWGKGLAQKREAESKQLELELEKDKPFARTRDDPDLDRMLKDQVRWGDPMAHLVKKKQPELVLPDLGTGEKMKESGFIIPQDIPTHSWLKRGLDAAPNRYGIRPGRHWDGVDRSNGFEKDLFKRTNEKQATEREAYLWSVADM